MIARPAVEASGVSKRFGSRDALCDVDFTARHGQLHGLLGPNGAGKTTLMRILLGLVRRDAGSVRLVGRNVDAAAERLPDPVAALIDTPAFYPYLSGRSNLSLLARLDGETRGLRHRSRSGPRTDWHRGASRRRRGRLLRRDAPAARPGRGLDPLAAAVVPRRANERADPAGARDVRALARQLADEGAAVVLSSHDMAEVEELCTMLTVMNDGRVVFSGTVGELRTRAPAVVHVLRTSDDGTALRVAAQRYAVKATPMSGGGLEVSALIEALDAYIIGLGRTGVAVRHLEPRTRSLESLFLELTGRTNADSGVRARLTPNRCTNRAWRREPARIRDCGGCRVVEAVRAAQGAPRSRRMRHQPVRLRSGDAGAEQPADRHPVRAIGH
jgi:ABC-2 type transport system ATP-binding protein